MADKDYDTRLEHLYDEGLADAEHIIPLVKEYIKNGDDFIPLLSSVNELDLWDVWHEAAETGSRDLSDEENTRIRRIMNGAERFYKAEIKIEKIGDKLLGDVVEYYSFCIRATISEFIAFAEYIFHHNAYDDLNYVVRMTESLAHDYIDENGFDNNDKDVQAMYHVVLYPLLLAERMQQGLPVPPDDDEEEKWYREHKETAKIRCGNTETLLKRLSVMPAEKIDASDLISIFLSAATTADPDSAFDELGALINKKDIWDKWDEATGLMAGADVTGLREDGTSDEDSPTGTDIAELMRLFREAEKEQTGGVDLAGRAHLSDKDDMILRMMGLS